MLCSYAPNSHKSRRSAITATLEAAFNSKTQYIARKINRADLQESFFDELVCLDFDLPNQKIELVSEKPLLVRTAIASENYKMDKLFKYVDENQELYIKRLADAVAVKVVFYEKKILKFGVSYC